jgi:hypothetical protein
MVGAGQQGETEFTILNAHRHLLVARGLRILPNVTTTNTTTSFATQVWGVHDSWSTYTLRASSPNRFVAGI